jgi:diaminopimelate epimerase
MIKFTKLQAAGNDFVLVETSDKERNWSPLAMAICDRHFGVGADGLLLLLPSDRADFGMRMFNPDGSEAEACGNGLTCLAKYVVNRGLADIRAQEISVETIAGIRIIKLYKEVTYRGKVEGAKPLRNLHIPLSFQGEGDKGGEVVTIQVSMGTPKLGAKDIPVAIEASARGLVDIKSMLSYPVIIANRELLLNFVSIGNPHAVYFWQQAVSDFPLSQIGPKVEHLSIFPNRINFEVANIVNRQRIEARVWERGAGETMACGSGACAVAVAAQLRGYIDNKVNVKLPGGILEVEWDGVGEIFLSAPAEIVFNGEWPEGGR